MKEFITNSERETFKLGEKIASQLKKGYAVLFTGEMGAGKTAISKGIANFFNVAEEVTSPTFSLVNEYYGDVEIFHFDLFRLNSFDDLYAIGFFDYVSRNGIYLVEWSENIPCLFDEFDNYITIGIEKVSETGRKFSITGLEVVE